MFNKRASTARPRVLIIGTGFGGIGAAIRIQQEGLADITILERADEVGGTWRDNTYPGAACDIPSHLYSFSFVPEPDWSRKYAPQEEIQGYLVECVDRFDLRRHIRFGRQVVRLEFDEATATWTATTEHGETYTADAVVSAIGGLRDPAYPTVPRTERFAGAQMHTARWDHGFDFAGKRVGVVGTGASAIQVAPQLAEVADHLTLFQRTPAWIVPRGDRAYTRFERWLFRRFDVVRRLHRAFIYTLLEGRYVFFATSVWLNRIAQLAALRHLRQQVDDPALRRQLTPNYRMGCKRVLVSDDFYPMFERDNVRLETSPIEEVTPTGVRTPGGQVDLDAIVWATGFSIDAVLHPIEVYGRDGARLHERFDDRPTAHLGITTPGFPNFFLLQGPNTGLGHNSIVFMLESQITYVLDALRRLRRADIAYLDVRPEVHDRFVRWVDERHEELVWNSGCSSWYVDDQGRNFTLWPGWTLRYRRETRRLDEDDYRIVARSDLPETTSPAA